LFSAGNKTNRIITFASLFVVTAAARLGAAESQPPNIVFIMLDDLGWSDVSFNGKKRDGSARCRNLPLLEPFITVSPTAQLVVTLGGIDRTQRVADRDKRPQVKQLAPRWLLLLVRGTCCGDGAVTSRLASALRRTVSSGLQDE
jgi:hypothetical protein